MDSRKSLWCVPWRCVLWRMYLTQMFWLLKSSVGQSFSGWEIISLQHWPLTSWILSVLSYWGDKGGGSSNYRNWPLNEAVAHHKTRRAIYLLNKRCVIEQNNISSTFSRTAFFENPHHKYNLWGNHAMRAFEKLQQCFSTEYES